MFRLETQVIPDEEVLRRFWNHKAKGPRLSANTAGLLSRGIARVREGQFRKAMALFTEATHADPACALAYAWRGEARLNLKYYQRDVPKALWKEHRKKYPYRRLFFVGRVPRPESYPELSSDFSRAIKLDPTCPWFYSHRGETRYLFVDYLGAMEDFNQILRLNGTYGFGHLWRAEIYYRTQRWDLAAAEAKRGLSLAPRAAWVHAFLARMQDSSGHRRDALQSIERAISLDPSIGWYRAWHGETLRKLGQLDEALDEFDAAISLDKADSLAYAWRGATLRRQQHPDKAAADLERAVELDPDYAYAFSELAHAQRQTGRMDEALRNITRAHLIDSKYLWAYRNPNFPQDFQRALADLDAEIRARPSAAALAWRGKIALEYGSVKDALAALDRALSEDANFFLAHLWRGQARMNLGDARVAAADFYQALRIDPSSGHAEGWLGRAADAHGRHREALEHFNTAICRDPHNCRSWVYYFRAKTKEKLADFSGALQDVDNHLWISRQDAQAEVLRGRLIHRLPGSPRMVLCA